MNCLDRSLLHALILLAVLLVGMLCETVDADELQHFINRRGDQLLDGEQPFRFISFNIPNLLVVEDAFAFTAPSPWRWPDEFEIEDALESVRQMGGQVVRTYVISVWREGSDIGECVHVRRPGEFNEEGFRALDKVLEIANRKGIRILIPLVDKAPWMGGVPQYTAFRGKPAQAFWSDPEIIADFKQTVAYVINRKNSYTGVAYKDDPAIFGWETGNEIDATAEWTRQIAAYIRALDANHLIVDGCSLRGVAQWQLDEPNTDVITTHHYPWGAMTDFVPPIRAAHAMTKGKKPYFVGEFGFVDTPRIRRVYDAVIQDGIPGALVWSLRFHRREGGFYWHMEVGTGGNFYKAYHWPGFDSGAAYDERAVLALTRAKAFEIRGLSPPALPPPAKPTLLVIEHPAAISWQGSAGAAAYDVLRATGPAGPWAVVGKNVSDADVQYRPLFDDQSAEPGQAYYYRVVARNAAGDSEPSNVVGPVQSTYRMLVDECADYSKLLGYDGSVAVRSENARQLQEDSHRFALPPGSSITYRVDGPIRAWRVYAFVAEEDAPLAISASTDGSSFSPLEMDRKSFAAGEGDYGYLSPVLFQGSADGQLQLEIALAESADRPASPDPSSTSERQIAPLQISRVEIDYGSK